MAMTRQFLLYLDGQMRFSFNLLTLTPLRYTKAQFFAYIQFLRHCIFRLLWIGLITASNIWTRTPYFVLGTLLFDSFLQILDFLSDPSPIIGYACQWLPNWLTDSLTYCRLVNLIDVSLACEDGNSKLVEVVDDEKQFTP